MNESTPTLEPNSSVAQSAEMIVEMRGISKIFHTDDLETHALSDVDLTIRRGEYVSISGPSGCGKSTLLSIVGLLDSPSSGEYNFMGRNLSGLGRNDLAKLRNLEIGFVFQSFNLIGDDTVFENVELPLLYRGMSKSERKERVMEALEKMELTHRAHHMPSQLSGGQQQRVAVARAIAGSPNILLADEPTGNLDSKNGERVMGILEQLHNEGSTICIVTHDERYAHAALREVHLFDGKITG